jgi:hypothetical protein
MRSRIRLSLLALSLTAGLLAVLWTASQFAPVSADTTVDLGVSIGAPAHVAPDTLVEVNVAYSNSGTSAAPDATWLTVTLPAEASFVHATDRSGNPLPPDFNNGTTLAWRVGPVPARTCCQHILVTARIAAAVTEGTALTHTAAIATTAPEADTANNTASAISLLCDMAGSQKRVQTREVMPGDVLTYTIDLSLARRQGQEALLQERWVTLTDTLPFSGHVRFLGWTGTVSGTHTGGTLQWQGRVRAGEPLQLQYRLGVEGVVTPGTTITNVARFGWGAGQMMLGPVTTVVTLPHDAHMFGPQGGAWQHSYGVTLTVPPGAVTDTTRFQFRPLITGTQAITPPAGWQYAQRAFEVAAWRFGEGIHQFARPVTITVDFRAADVSGLERHSLRLWYRQGEGEPWAMLGDPEAMTTETVTFTTDHLTQFALFGRYAHSVYLPLLVRQDN